MKIQTRIEGFFIRDADESDCRLILSFIRELAEYERLLHEVEATEEILNHSLFSNQPYARVIIGEFQGQPVGYALFFNNFSTFTGRPGIYLEDLYVTPDMRGKGFGKSLLAYLAKLAYEENYTRVEWSVLDWNQPSILFYHSIGAIPMDGWTTQRLHGQALEKFAKEF